MQVSTAGELVSSLALLKRRLAAGGCWLAQSHVADGEDAAADGEEAQDDLNNSFLVENRHKIVVLKCNLSKPFLEII